MAIYKIVIADDHAIFRDGIKELINSRPGIGVTGEAADGMALLKVLSRQTPDLVILDITMPGLSGIEIAREIRRRWPRLAILFLSMHKKKEYLKRALATGARGYMIKENTAEELLAAIAAIRRGGTYVSPTLINAFSTDIIDIFRDNSSRTKDPLTPRERQVLKLIAEGYTNAQIGELLFISERTVHRHRANIRSKLQLKRTADLIKYALKHNLISPNG